MLREFKSEHYRNFSDFLAACDSRTPNSWVWDNREHAAKWAGDDYETARELLLHGDAKAVASLTPRKVAAAESIRPCNVRDVCGYSPIVPAALEGLPLCMRRRKKAATRERVVTLAVDVSYACNVSAEQVARRGREICAFIRGAELAGYRVALDILGEFSRDDTPYAYACRVNVKRADQNLDIKRVCYPLTHASMLRQLFFDWYERLPGARKIEGYGTTLTGARLSFQREIFKRMLKDHEYFVDFMTTDLNTLLK